MILRSIRVRNFAHLNPGAIIEGLADRFTLIEGTNGAGKSTLFRALCYALYQNHTSAGENVQDRIVPRGAEAGPRVEVDFEHDDRSWRICKQWVRRKEAVLSEKIEGAYRTVAEADAADERLRELLGSRAGKKRVPDPADRGIGEVLLVDQGLVRYGQLGEAAREGFRGIIRGTRTSGAAQRLLDRAAKRHEEWFTAGSGLKTGQGAAPPVRLRAELARIEADLSVLRRKLAGAEELERALAEPDLSPEQEQRERDELERASREEEGRCKQAIALHSAIEPLQAKVHDVTRKLADDASARARLASEAVELAAEKAGLETVRAALEREQLLRTDLDARLEQAEAELHTSRSEHEETLRTLRSALDAAREARSKADKISDLEPRLTRWEGTGTDLAQVESKLQERGRPDTNELEAISALAARTGELDRMLARLDLRVSITARTRLTIVGPEGPATLAEGQVRRLRGHDPLRFEIGGVAAFEVAGPEIVERADLTAERSRAQEEFARLSSSFETTDLVELQTLARERALLERERRELAAQRSGLFDSREEAIKARSDLRSSRARLGQLLESHPEWVAAAPSQAAVAAFEARLEHEEKRGGELVRARKDALTDLANQVKIATIRCNELRERHSQAQNSIAGREGRIRTLQDTLAGEQVSTSLAAELASARTGLAESLEALELLGDVDSARERARRASNDFERERSDAKTRRAGNLRLLGELRKEGLHASADELEAQEQSLRDQIARAELEAEAIRLLHSTLQAEQLRSIEAIVRPLTERVERMATAVFGNPVRISAGEELSVRGISVAGGHEIEVDLLSTGEHDQIALLARIALAELFADKHGRQVLVLDDPLVTSAPERRGRILDILIRASEKLQIVVFTCDPKEWRGLPDDTGRIEMAEALRVAASRA